MGSIPVDSIVVISFTSLGVNHVGESYKQNLVQLLFLLISF